MTEEQVKQEKLKLLDEVDRRIIGENHALFGHGEDWEGARPENELKDEQRKTLEAIRKEIV